MNPSVKQLAETLLWSEYDRDGDDEPLDSKFSPEDIDSKSLSELHQRFQKFLSEAEAKITKLKGDGWSSVEDFYTGSAKSGYQLEHDYIMTVNGHGCGFWETSDWLPEVGDILTKLAKEEKQISCWVKDETVHIEFG